MWSRGFLQQVIRRASTAAQVRGWDSRSAGTASAALTVLSMTQSARCTCRLNTSPAGVRLFDHLPSLHQAGILFDVDGVLLRGGSVIPAARQALRKLVDRNNNFLLPVVFVTNAGSCQRNQKAQQLSHLLDVQVGAPSKEVLSRHVRNVIRFHRSSVHVVLWCLDHKSCDFVADNT